MQKVLYRSQIREYSDYLNLGMIEYLSRDLTESFEGFDDCDLMSLQWYDVTSEDPDVDVSQILIYIDREDLFFFCSDDRSYNRCCAMLSVAKNVETKRRSVKEQVSEEIPQTPSVPLSAMEGAADREKGKEEKEAATSKPSKSKNLDLKANERALYLFFVALLSQDARQLEKLEEEITNAEEDALEYSRTDYLNNIREFRKRLFHLKRYYEELNTITDNLMANDNKIFTKDGVRHFSIINNRVDHFCSNVMSLRDYVNQMRETCQSQIDNEQNRLMRVFTVVSAIFLPLTLIVGWYGMNFQYMPELSWRYGYPMVIILCLIVSVGMVLWFRHKKWL